MYPVLPSAGHESEGRWPPLAGSLARLPTGVPGRPVLVLVVGKGGVGKTTVAAALALLRAGSGRSTLLLSVDPAHSLKDALGIDPGPEPVLVPGIQGLRALNVDAAHERVRFLDGHRDALLDLFDRGTHLDRTDALGFADQAIPGMDELAGLLRLSDLLRDDSDLIVDTAPTGHTLRLLDLPALARAWLATLRDIQTRDRVVSTALVGAYHPGEGVRMIDLLERRILLFEEVLHDPARCAVLLVTTRDPVVMAETLRYQDALAQRGLFVAAVVVNREDPAGARGAGPSGDRIVQLPLLSPEPTGLAGIRRVAACLQDGGWGDVPQPGQPSATVLTGDAFRPPIDRSLYLVAGKGGVGKSTAAAALALYLASQGRRTLLLSIDPAGSLSEVLETAVSARAAAVPGVPELHVQQLDPGAVWGRFRTGYRDDAQRFLADLTDASDPFGLEWVERFTDLAPPGLDELAALMEVVDAMEVRSYDALVVDSAPTGHFLRLLELPEVALGWVHEVMRLLLRYREVVAPGALAGKLLELARTLRRFSEMLRDPATSWLLWVALTQESSVSESVNAGERLAAMGITPAALLLNRAAAPMALAATAAGLRERMPGVPLAVAPELPVGPVGVGPLVTHADGWRHLRPEFL